MKKGILNIIAVLFCWSLGYSQVETYDSEQFILTGDEHYNNGEFEKSIDYFSKVDELDPNYLDALAEKAYSLIAMEKAEDAIAFIEPLYLDNRFPESPNLYLVYSSLLSGLEKYDEAEKILLECKEVVPYYSDLYFNLGLNYYNQNEYQKSIDQFKEAITINPNSSRSHFMLGAIALESGKIAEGFLAMMGYLANSPDDEFSENAIASLNLKMAQNYLETSDLVFSENGDDFEELTTILRSQIALNKNYKLKCDIDDIYPRHAQALMEYASQHEGKDGFFERNYIPFLAEIYNDGLNEEFIYYTLIGSNEDILKKLKKQEKKIVKFNDEYYIPKFWNTFASRKIDHFGELTDVVIYLSDDVPYQITPIVDGERHGKCKYVDKFGRTTTEGMFDKGVASGMTKYYDSESNLIEESSFENGEYQGQTRSYYANGNLSLEANYKDGVLDGNYKNYYVTGGVSCNNNLKNGEYDGKSECFHANGQKRLSITYINGKLDGQSVGYREDGSKKYVENYSNGELDGANISYGINGNILYDINYNKNLPSESYEVKDRFGNVKTKMEIDGAKSSLTNYDLGEISSIEKYKDYNQTHGLFFEDGIKYLEEEYDDGKLKSAKQFTAKDTKGKKLKLEKYTVTSFDGTKLGENSYSKGLPKGKHTRYLRNGNLESEIKFLDGTGNTEATRYDRFGLLEAKYYLKDNNIEGEYLSYKKGVLISKYNYKEGNLHGPFWSYNADGSIATKGFAIGGYKQGLMHYYLSSGEIYKEEKYIDDESIYLKKFDDGKEVERFDFTNKTGTFKLWENGKYDTEEITLVNGTYEGEHIIKDRNGEVNYRANFLNGLRHGEQTYYYPSGNLRHIGMSKFGNYEGISKYYDHVGNLYVTSNFQDNMSEGLENRYFSNGTVKNTCYYHQDLKNGKYSYFNYKGDTLLNLEYKSGLIVSYQSIKEGELGEVIEISNKPYKLEGTYKNGKQAFSIEIEKMLLNNQLKFYQENGNPIYSIDYKNFLLNGFRKEYYENGQLYKNGQFTNGNMNGLLEFFDQDGNVLIRANYENDELEGEYEIYKDGKLNSTKIYKKDVFISIK